MTGTDRTTSPPTRPRRGLPLAVGAVLALAALAACGSDAPAEDTAATASSAAPSTEESPAAAGSSAESGSTSVQVTSVDFGYELALSVCRAGENTIPLTTGGDGPHDLVGEREGLEMGASDAIDPGQSTTLTVALEPGEYVFYCSIGNHRSMGMEVTVEVAA